MIPVLSSLLYMSSRPRAASPTSRSLRQVRSISLHCSTICKEKGKEASVNFSPDVEFSLQSLLQPQSRQKHVLALSESRTCLVGAVTEKQVRHTYDHGLPKSESTYIIDTIPSASSLCIHQHTVALTFQTCCSTYKFSTTRSTKVNQYKRPTTMSNLITHDHE